jgi:dihydrofolate synthase/folylpolyglutamate synthase
MNQRREEHFDWLLSLAQFGIKFGLGNIRAILDALNRPERSFRSIHIAGTNGKGSVTAMLDAALLAAGIHTGRYTSPHLLDLTERFAVDGQPVSLRELADGVETVRSVVERLRTDGLLEVHPTFFEVTTAVAFELFRRRSVDVAVCEVGLGGRLDATNVLSPVACAITSIGFDHQQYLGNTLADIAAEKAGIIKPRTPVVVGPMPAEAAQTIAGRARELAAPVIWSADGVTVRTGPELQDGRQQLALSTSSHDYGTLTLGLAGGHQIHNAVVAVRLLEVVNHSGVPIGSEAIGRGLAGVQWPGRLQRVRHGNRELLLDAAHNEDGAAALARYLAAHPPAMPLVFAAMRDKDIEPMLRTLAPHVSSIVVTRASNPRSADPLAVRSIVTRIDSHLQVDTADAPADAVRIAWSDAPAVLVAGSIFLLADVMREFGGS